MHKQFYSIRVKNLMMNKCLRLCPEPDNPVDKNTIAFQYKLNDKWNMFGYIVRELTADVHKAMQDNSIQEVSFKTIRYVWSWPYSEPGFYAAVKMSKRELWSDAVVKHASTDKA